MRVPPETRQALARLGAPIAFLLAATVAVLLVRSALYAGGDPHGGTASKPPAAPHRVRDRSGGRRRQAPAVYDRVAAGETLQTIADAHGTTVGRLLRLNPGIDARSLHVGQRVRVR